MSDATPPGFVAGRACGPCSLCCKIMEVKKFAKPKGRWCAQARPGQGCAIYDTRPQICRGFHCAWLTKGDLDGRWVPTESRTVLVEEDQGRRVIAHVAPDDADAWRREPYESDLRRWAREGRQVAVYAGKRVIVIHPEGETDLGVVGDDEMIGVRTEATPFGRRYAAFKLRRAS